MGDLPIVCTLDEDMRKTRREQLIAGLVADADAREEVTEGYRLRFGRADVVPRLMQVIEAERKCCRFLRFEVAFEPDLGPIWLTVTGPAGTRDFLAALD
jgi:hypothetical protein